MWTVSSSGIFREGVGKANHLGSNDLKQKSRQ